MDNSIFDFICDNFQGIQRNRALKIFDGQDITKEEEKMFYSNWIIRLKFDLRKALKAQGALYSQRHECLKKAEKAEKRNDIIHSAEYRGAASESNESIEKYNEYLASAGALCMSLFEKVNGLFTDDEIAQLMSASIYQVHQCRQEYEKYKDTNIRNSGFLNDAIFIYQVEYRGDYRGKEEGWLDCKEFEMPFYNAQKIWMFREIHCNKELEKLTDKYIYEDMGLKEGSYIAKEDLEGNIKSMEPVVSKVTVRDLMKGYEDAERNGIIKRHKSYNLDENSQVRLEKVLDYEVNDGYVEVGGRRFDYTPNMYKVSNMDKKFLGFVLKKSS